MMELEKAVEALAPGLLRYCMAVTGDRALAEDVSQEALAALVDRWRRRGAPDSVDAFVSVFDRGAGGGNTPAAFFNLVGAVDSDNSDPIMDMVTIIDPDPGEDLLVEQTGTTTLYGTFSILPSGT